MTGEHDRIIEEIRAVLTAVDNRERDGEWHIEAQDDEQDSHRYIYVYLGSPGTKRVLADGWSTGLFARPQPTRRQNDDPENASPIATFIANCPRYLTYLLEMADRFHDLEEDLRVSGGYQAGLAEGRRLERARRDDDAPITEDWLFPIAPRATRSTDRYTNQVILQGDRWLGLTPLSAGDGFSCSIVLGNYPGTYIALVRTRGELIRLVEGLTGKDWPA